MRGVVGRGAWIALLVAAFVGPVASASAAESTARRNALERQIRALADRHVAAGAPLQSTLAVHLYRGSGRGVGLSDERIVEIYEAEYLEAEHDQKSFWDRRLQKLGWVAALLLVVAYGVQRAFGASLARAFDKLLDWLFAHFGSMRLLRRGALRRYRRRVAERMHLVRVPFRPGKPIKIVDAFVPLRSREQDDSVMPYELMHGYRRIVAVGPPGSGKSVLLRRIAYDFAARKPVPYPSLIPVYVEMHRFNGSHHDVERLIVETFARNGFENAAGFVGQQLRTGGLLLLLDGLDEVPTRTRQAVAAAVVAFLEQHHTCRALMTCRNAVYNGEFESVADVTVSLAELAPRQMLRFLQAWQQEYGPPKSVEHLMASLREHPRIMALARNPLMLTIIAHLYAENPDYVLPRSRAEFYREAADILLRQWHKEQNAYQAVPKRYVLRYLALHIQAGTITGDADDDRQAPRVADVLAATQRICPQLGLEETEARALLEEIVERSGLLLAVDGGERYQFGHLTQQEFFAAEQLLDRPDLLLEHYRSDPSTWGEVIKLWCGLSADSSKLVAEIREHDENLALQCLGDAVCLDDQLTVGLVDAAFERLEGGGADLESVEQGLAGVGADLGPRGQAVLRRLVELLDSHDDAVSARAARVLALTNAPAAASALALRLGSESIHDALVRLGDLAVADVAKAAEGGAIEAIWILTRIGTPTAGDALVRQVLGEGPMARAAAWGLGSLLGYEGFVASLDRSPLASVVWSEEDRRYEWLSVPLVFDEKLSLLIARTARLIAATPDRECPEDISVDAGLAVPLCATRSAEVRDCRRRSVTPELVAAANTLLGRECFSFDNGRFVATASRGARRLPPGSLVARDSIPSRELLPGASAHHGQRGHSRGMLMSSLISEVPVSDWEAPDRARVEALGRFVELYPERSQCDRVTRTLLSGLPPAIALVFFQGLLVRRAPSRESWSTVTGATPAFARAWQRLLAASGMAVFAAFAAMQSLQWAQTGATVLAVAGILLLAIVLSNFLIALWFAFVRSDSERSVLQYLAPLFAVLLLHEWSTRKPGTKESVRGALRDRQFLLALPFVPAVVVVSSIGLTTLVPFPLVVVAWTVFVVAVGAMVGSTDYMEVNPFADVFAFGRLRRLRDAGPTGGLDVLVETLRGALKRWGSPDAERSEQMHSGQA